VGVSLADVRAARDRIAPHLRRTPLLRSPLLSRRSGLDVWLKLETQQHTGSFKPRGALNKLMALGPAERARGVTTASAGNHALGTAYAWGNASPAKLAKLREYPVRLHTVGSTYEDAQQAALAHSGRTGATFTSAYDDEAVVAGHGSCGLEILDELESFDAIVIPVGGGALSAGIAVAVKGLRPRTRVIGVNAAASPSALLSFQRGEALDPFDHEPSMAHGLAGGYGRIPFAVARTLIDEIVLVSEAEMRRAMATLIDTDQVLAEASGIAGVAAVIEGKASGLSGRVVVVVSGGNVDSAMLREVLG
jgi:threonine dehydratase